MVRTYFRLAVVAAALLASGAVQAKPTDLAKRSAASSVGVCVRWGADDLHIEDAVVVEPSGDVALDKSIPGSLRAMNWARPDGDQGHWVGVSIALNGGSASGLRPDCAGLPIQSKANESSAPAG
jgi:hypothetical protein